jgi:hypothetical protein
MTSLTLVRRIRARPQIVLMQSRPPRESRNSGVPTRGQCWRRRSIRASAAAIACASVCSTVPSTRAAASFSERVVLSWRWKGGVEPAGRGSRLRSRPFRKAPDSPSSIRDCMMRKRAAAMKRAGRARSTSSKRILPREPPRDFLRPWGAAPSSQPLVLITYRLVGRLRL